MEYLKSHIYCCCYQINTLCLFEKLFGLRLPLKASTAQLKAAISIMFAELLQLCYFFLRLKTVEERKHNKKIRY